MGVEGVVEMGEGREGREGRERVRMEERLTMMEGAGEGDGREEEERGEEERGEEEAEGGCVDGGEVGHSAPHHQRGGEEKPKQ